MLDTALECDLSAYDAELVVLARTLGVALVTLDGEILSGAGDVAVWLGGHMRNSQRRASG